MRRLSAILFNATALLSLLLCIATVGLWVRSYYREDFIDLGGGAASLDAGLRNPERGRLLDSLKGAILIDHYAWRDPATASL